MPRRVTALCHRFFLSRDSQRFRFDVHVPIAFVLGPLSVLRPMPFALLLWAYLLAFWWCALTLPLPDEDTRVGRPARAQRSAPQKSAHTPPHISANYPIHWGALKARVPEDVYRLCLEVAHASLPFESQLAKWMPDRADPLKMLVLLSQSPRPLSVWTTSDPTARNALDHTRLHWDTIERQANALQRDARTAALVRALMAAFAADARIARAVCFRLDEAFEHLETWLRTEEASSHRAQAWLRRTDPEPSAAPEPSHQSAEGTARSAHAAPEAGCAPPVPIPAASLPVAVSPSVVLGDAAPVPVATDGTAEGPMMVAARWTGA